MSDRANGGIRRTAPRHPAAEAFAGERGLSLAEVAVAAALGLISMLIALYLYQALHFVFKKGEMAADQQQAVRLGMEVMTRDLRLAGFNARPEGSRVRIDEPIEGAWGGAILVRADYDAVDPSGLASDPESFIPGVFNTCSTGNDEVVGYVLRKPDGSGGSSITFDADVHSAVLKTSPLYGQVAERDNVAETVTIPAVAVTQSAPPYTLYKVSLSNAAADYGTAGFVRLVPVADNIWSMKLTYHDESGAVISAPGGADTTAAREARDRISRVAIEIVGMAAQPDADYTDPADPSLATRHYRKFSLASEATVRNKGLFGLADLDLTAPTTPAGLSTCAGHCGGMVLDWTPNAPAEGVTRYTVRYGTNPSGLNATRSTTDDYLWIPGLASSNYYFQVRAEDGSGNRSIYSGPVSALVRDDVSPTLTTPVSVDQAGAVVSGGAAAGPVNGQVNLSWAPVVTNVEALACDPGGAHLLRDIRGYRIYRSTTAGTGPTGPPIVDESSLTTTTWSDQGVVNCRDYYYHVDAVDDCGHESTPWGTSSPGRAESAIAPARPIGLAATRTGPTTVHLAWSPVTTDTASTPVTIDTYEIHRSVLPVDGIDPYTSTYTQIATATTATVFDDYAAPPGSPSTEVYYRIRARDDCPNVSPFSDPAGATCTFPGTVALSPSSGSTVQLGPTTVTVTYTGADTLASCSLTISKNGGTTDLIDTIAGPGPVYTFNWTPGQGIGDYTVAATFTNTAGCTSPAGGTYTVVYAAACCLSVNPANSVVITQGTHGRRLQFRLDNTGACGDAVDVREIVTRLALDQCSCNGLPGLVRILDAGTGAVLYSQPSGASLPTTAALSSPLRVPDSGSVLVEMEFDTDIQDRCNGTGGNILRRDRLSSDMTFDTVSTSGRANCTNLVLVNGAPTP